MGYAVKSPPRRLAAQGRIGISKDARTNERAPTPRKELQPDALDEDETAARGRAAANDASPAGSPAPSDASNDRETASVEGRGPSRKAASPLDTLAAIAEMEARSVERELGIAREEESVFAAPGPEEGAREGGRRTLVTPHNGSSSSLSHAEAGAEASWEPNEGSAERVDSTKGAQDHSPGGKEELMKGDEEETPPVPEALEVKPDAATSQSTQASKELPKGEAGEHNRRSSKHPGAHHRYPPHPYPPYGAWYPPPPPPPSHYHHHHPYHPPPPHPTYHPYPPHYRHPNPPPYWSVTASKKKQSAAKKEVRKELSAEGATGETKASLAKSEESVATQPLPKLPPKKRKFRELAGLEPMASEDARASCDRRSPSESPSVEHGPVDGDRDAGEDETRVNEAEKKRIESNRTRGTKGSFRAGRHHFHPVHHPAHSYRPGYYYPPPPYGYPPPPYHYHRPPSRASPQSRTRADQRGNEERKEQGDKSNRGSVQQHFVPERVASNEKAAAITEKMVPSEGDDGEERVKQFSLHDDASVNDKQTKATDEAEVGPCIVLNLHGTALASFLGKNVETAEVPPFQTLVNYPEHLPTQRRRGSAAWTSTPSDRATTHRDCVMCGNRCLFGSNASSANAASPSSGDGNESDSSAPSSKSGAASSSTTSATYQRQRFTIPRQNKGLCNSCDVKVWLYAPPGDDKTSVETGQIAIKWCKGCKNFRQWPHSFGEKKRATKCAKCRDRQKNKYARSKK